MLLVKTWILRSRFVVEYAVVARGERNEKTGSMLGKCRGY